MLRSISKQSGESAESVLEKTKKKATVRRESESAPPSSSALKRMQLQQAWFPTARCRRLSSPKNLITKRINRHSSFYCLLLFYCNHCAPTLPVTAVLQVYKYLESIFSTNNGSFVQNAFHRHWNQLPASFRQPCTNLSNSDSPSSLSHHSHHPSPPLFQCRL